mgnify:CR=1 FL=1
MIDTIRIRLPLTEPLNKTIYAEIFLKEQRARCSKKKILKEERYQIILPSSDESAWVSVQCSLPRYLHGNNVKTLSYAQTVTAIQGLLNDVAKDLKLSAIPTFDQIDVVSADLVNDWIVKSPEAYLAVIERFAMVRGNHSLHVWKNGMDKGTTVKCGSNRQMLMVYNKEAQVNFLSKRRVVRDDELDLAAGRLRAEVRLKGRGWFPYIDDPSPSLRKVLLYLQMHGRRPLLDKFSRLTDGWDVSPLEDATMKLTVAYGAKRGRKLAETLAMVRAMGVHKYRQICRPDDSTWSRFRRALREAGVSMTDSGGLKKLTVRQFDTIPSCRIYSSLVFLNQMAAEPRDEFEVDEDGNVWDISIQDCVKLAVWEDAF